MKCKLSHDSTLPEDYEPEPREWNACTLTEIADAYKTDKGSLDHNYTAIYEHYMEPLRNTPIRLLEIGIACGASLKTWARYFPNAQIVGVDIRPECANVCKSYPSIRTIIGDATKTAISGPWDIIIDDGSHIAADMAAALTLLWPQLRDDGLYIIEDTACTMSRGYWRPGRQPGGDERLAYSQIVSEFMQACDSSGDVSWVHAYPQILMIRKRAVTDK
jgi:hypothetical protein